MLDKCSRGLLRSHADGEAKTVEVPAVSLEEVLLAIPKAVRVSLVKIDAQGMDLRLFLSGGQQLQRVEKAQCKVQNLTEQEPGSLYKGGGTLAEMSPAMRQVGFVEAGCRLHDCSVLKFDCFFLRPAGACDCELSSAWAALPTVLPPEAVVLDIGTFLDLRRLATLRLAVRFPGQVLAIDPAGAVSLVPFPGQPADLRVYNATRVEPYMATDVRLRVARRLDEVPLELLQRVRVARFDCGGCEKHIVGWLPRDVHVLPARHCRQDTPFTSCLEAVAPRYRLAEEAERGRLFQECLYEAQHPCDCSARPLQHALVHNSGFGATVITLARSFAYAIHHEMLFLPHGPWSYGASEGWTEYFEPPTHCTAEEAFDVLEERAGYYWGHVTPPGRFFGRIREMLCFGLAGPPTVEERGGKDFLDPKQSSACNVNAGWIMHHIVTYLLRKRARIAARVEERVLRVEAARPLWRFTSVGLHFRAVTVWMDEDRHAVPFAAYMGGLQKLVEYSEASWTMGPPAWMTMSRGVFGMLGAGWSANDEDISTLSIVCG